MKRKIKNNQIGGYKIDIYASEDKYPRHYLYIGTSDVNKTCKRTVERFKERHDVFCKDKVIIARFQYE